VAFDHRTGAAGKNPYAPVMGKTFVGFDETGPITVLDADRAATLASWVACVIPGNAEWPSADEVDTVAYIDAIVRKAPELRPVLLSGVDAVERAAHAVHGRPFVEISAAEQTAILRDAETTAAPEAFSMILELTYEAYYRSPQVQQVVKERTGFDITNTVVGKPMEPFPLERLRPISARPDRYRSVPA
jgi:hypothetical protein